MTISTTQYGLGTSITSRYPWGTFVSAKVLCSDGKVRATSRIALTADTFYSVPCSVKVQGRTVSGYLTTETAQGYSTSLGELDPTVAKFIAVEYGKNHGLLPRGAYRTSRDEQVQ